MRRPPPITRGWFPARVLLVVLAVVMLVGLVFWLPSDRVTALAALVSAVGVCLGALPRDPHNRSRRRGWRR